MPPKKGNKRSAQKGRSSGSNPPKTSSSKRGAKMHATNYATSAMRKSYFLISSHKVGGNSALRVNLCDSMGELYGPARENGIKSDSIPFSLASNSLALSSLGQVFPKLQGLSRIASRYQVRKARLHWQSLCSADTVGNVSLALVPGSADAVITPAEMASFDHGAIGPLRENFSTDVFRNLEQRWFFCDASEGQTGDDPRFNVPFSILRLIKEDTNRETGLVWLELEIDFVDFRPATQSSVNLQVGIPSAGSQTFTGGAPNVQNVISWGLNQGMEGLFDWGTDFVQSYYGTGSPTPITPAPGSLVGVDGNQQVDAWLDLFLNAVTLPSRENSIVHEWPVTSWEEVKTSEENVFPQKWTQPKRSRVICAFKSVSEAKRALLAGFDPERVARETPNAAGDVTVSLYFQPAEPYAGVVPIYSQVISGGTGAFEHIIQTSTSTDTGPGHFLWNLIPTGTEHRTVSANSNMSIDVLDRVSF